MLSSFDASSFTRSYEKAGAPRLMVYVNRALSDNVREWESPVRAKVGYVQTSTTDGKPTKTVGTAVAAIETRADDGAGRERPDHWTWQLEDAVLQPLISNGVRVLDRAVVLRDVAAETSPDPLGDVPAKTIESKALKANADILVEIQVSSFPANRLGYVFRLQAIDLKSKTILASCSSANWQGQRRIRGQYELTEQGYRKSGLPRPDDVGVWLAIDLMNALTQRL